MAGEVRPFRAFTDGDPAGRACARNDRRAGYREDCK
jgi:hypothetical protein